MSNELTLDIIDNTTSRDAGFFTITPAFAKSVLEHCNPVNRRIRPTKIDQLLRDFRANKFMTNGESIIFADTGVLLDGQHRLKACADTGVSFCSAVIMGVDEAARKSIDQGGVRKFGEVLNLNGVKNGTLVGAIARSFTGYLETGGISLGGTSRITRNELEDTLDAYPQIHTIATWAHTEGTYAKGICAASHLGTARVILEPIYGDDAVYFLERVARGDNITTTSPAYAVRRRLHMAKCTTAVTLEAILRGCVADIEGRTFTRVQIEGKFPILRKKAKT